MWKDLAVILLSIDGDIIFRTDDQQLSMKKWLYVRLAWLSGQESFMYSKIFERLESCLQPFK